jgi:hypothetical protein
MKWSKLKATVESRFADELRGRVRLHTTEYRHYSSQGRAWITIDGEEIINMPASIDWQLMDKEEKDSRLGLRRLSRAVRVYPELSINEILNSEDSVVRAIGMLDRRLGKRRLAKLDVSDEPPLVKILYLVRCEAVNITPIISDEKQDLRKHLTERNVYSKRYREENRKRIAIARREADQTLACATKHNLRALITRIKKNEITESELRTEVARIIYAAFQLNENPDDLCRCLVHVEANSKLLESTNFAAGVTCLARSAESWVRPIESWTPRSHNARKQFSSLARHLWANYDVPLFMDQSWTEGGDREQAWFRHIGIGQSIRTASELPIEMTKKMAHHFTSAPPDYTIHAAFRWSQVHALGGDRRLADALRDTRLVRGFKDDSFWLTVIRFFIKNPMLDTAHINPIIDYIWNQKYEPVIVFIDRGVAEQRPPQQPNFSMRGRSAVSLLRAVDEWHRRLGKEVLAGNLQWKKSEISDFTHLEGQAEKGNMRQWRIRELVNSAELVAEGRQMEHCVSTYASSCHSGQCSIWTMEVETNEGVEKCVTIEVKHPEDEIRQVRGKRNRFASSDEMQMVRRWASLHNLRVAGYL